MTSPSHPCALLDEVISGQKAGRAIGVASVCSAHPLVLEASMRHALATGGSVLIEATSNQVDQFGGYTGMTPVDFVAVCRGLAEAVGLPRERVVLGGDHLGVNRWRGLPAAEAMDHADVLVRSYVEAGFTKIHLDCSYACADDVEPLLDEVVAARAARLCAVAEAASEAIGAPGSLRYVVGTEVPVPGGADHAIEGLVPTSAASARHTIAAHREAFEAAGVGGAWPRVMALVVQPGVEFDHHAVVQYDRTRTGELQAVLDDAPAMVFEAHSTDYQSTANLRALVEDHWGVLKVGPWLTFALREALFALCAVEDEVVPDGSRSRLREVVEERMVAEPGYWAPYYSGSEAERAFARVWSYSDRIRYYWADPEVVAAQERLFANLDAAVVRMSLVSQHLPRQHDRIVAGELGEGGVRASARELAMDRVRDVLRVYDEATGRAPACC